MKPVITKKPYTDDNDIYRFTISDIHVSLANALRRIILSDIETIVFYTETYQDNKCTIHKNTCRLHNEIVKQRLSSIPIWIVTIMMAVIAVYYSSNTKMLMWVFLGGVVAYKLTYRILYFLVFKVKLEAVNPKQNGD